MPRNCAECIIWAAAIVVLAAPVAEAQDGSGPDLVVESPSASDDSLVAGEEFRLTVTVRNVGDGDAAATTLRYYQSADATITASDTEILMHRQLALNASWKSTWTIRVTVLSTGTYYYGACVDAVSGESDTTNNCSTSVQVETTPPPPTTTNPDLVVDSPSVSDNSPVSEAAFTFSADVRNRGNGDSAATTLHYYRSTDATITTSDTSVGTDTVAALSASGTSAESIELTAPTAAGTYYYGACVDAVSGESDTTNNCSASVQIDVTESPTPPATAPDLQVGSPSVSDSSPDVETSFTLSAEVRNAGSGDAAATTLRYYQSADTTITAYDTEVGTDAVAGLAASATSSQSVELTAPSAAGTYYYGACVEAVADESDTTNNCSTSVQVDVSQPPQPPPPPPQTAPDLAVGSPSVSDPSPVAGAAFTLSAEVRNGGDGSSATTTLRYYRSADAMITMSDTEVGTDAVAGLAASATSSQSVELTAPSAGTYYYGACVDAVAAESDTTNNCSTSVQVDVSEAVPALPLLAQLLLALGLVALGTGFAARLRQRWETGLSDR